MRLVTFEASHGRAKPVHQIATRENERTYEVMVDGTC